MTRPIAIKIVAQGNLFVVEHSRLHSTSVVQKSQRGSVKRFSEKSRKRMLDKIARLDKAKLARIRCKFITLTYQENLTNHHKAMRDLKVFVQRIRRKFPACWLLWKKELQKRGAIHFHILLGGVPYYDVVVAQDDWNEVSGQTMRNTLDMETINSVNGAMYYVSKYMAKTDLNDETEPQGHHVSKEVSPSAPLGSSIFHNRPKGESTGRWWGVSGAKFMPFAPLYQHETFTYPENLKRALKHIHSEYKAFERGFTVYSAFAEQYAIGAVFMLARIGSHDSASLDAHMINTYYKHNMNRNRRNGDEHMKLRRNLQRESEREFNELVAACGSVGKAMAVSKMIERQDWHEYKKSHHWNCEAVQAGNEIVYRVGVKPNFAKRIDK